MDKQMTEDQLAPIFIRRIAEIRASKKLPPVVEDIRPLKQQERSSLEETSTPGANSTKRLQPNLPKRYLLKGPRTAYLRMGIPLYEASIKCDWKAAKAILEETPTLVRYSITENGETALHVAASAKVSKKRGQVFVKNLVDKMKPKDLALVNENSNTALYLAAAAGNLEMIEIMVEKNRDLLKIPGTEQQMLPLYVAVLLGNYDVVQYLYKNSNDLCDDDGWTDMNRRWILEKCVENEMFDMALEIVEKYPILSSGNLLAILARKPKAFHETQSTFKGAVFKLAKHIYSVLAFSGTKVKAPENRSNALPLLKVIWKDIAKKPKDKIDDILRGPPDLNKQDKSAPGRVVLMQLQKLISDHINRADHIIRGPPNISQLINLISESLVRLHVETENIIRGSQDKSLELQELISKSIVNLHDEIQRIHEITGKENQEAIQLQKLQQVISDHIEIMKTGSQKVIRRPGRKTYSSQVLFIAAEMGNTKFLVELIRQYPDLIWMVNDKNQTIFHRAVRYRHTGIYNLLYEIGAMKDMITPLQDPKGNNMLHLVGMRAKGKKLEDVPGTALQMQTELLWFQEVEKMIPPSHRERKNKDGLTPRELFTKEHQEMVTEGEKWMKKIASQCIVVAALIATMVFTAAFTVPGGFDQKNGIPVFHSKVSFQIFVVTDAISLLLSTASILHMFLSIFTSHYDEGDFLVSLPKKLTVGLTYLFISIASMLVAFCTGFFVLYQKGLLWMPILISSFALLSFFLSVRMHLFAFFIVIFSAFKSILPFKPSKRVLYYENPKV